MRQSLSSLRLGGLNELHVLLLAFLHLRRGQLGTGALLVVLDVVTVDELAGDSVVSVGQSLLGEDKLILSVHDFNFAFQTAQTADSLAVFLQIEVLGVAVRTDTGIRLFSSVSSASVLSSCTGASSLTEA